MTPWLDLALSLAALPLVLVTGYLAFLTVFSRRCRVSGTEQPLYRFDIVVPAHNEAVGIAATVESLRAIDYPIRLRRIVVVADNCTDDTAAAAAAAGAMVITRTNETLRGKGYALDDAFNRVIGDGFADAAVVIDADTVVSANLLKAFAARLARGAHAVQAEYGVRNARDSWRTRLMAFAFALFHTLRSSARERLGLSAGLRGNGMCFSLEILRRVPHRAFSVVEDVEYGIRLGLAGYRVHYAGEATVFGEMASDAAAAKTQRQRWEGGRWQMIKRFAEPLFSEALRRRSAVLLDLAIDLCVPPLSYIGLAVTALLAGAAAASHAAGHVLASLVMAGVCSMFLILYIARGVQLAQTGLRAVLDLAWAPFYALWKLGLFLRPAPHRRGEWVRTARGHERSAT